MNLSWVSIRSTLSTGGILMLRRVLVVTLATTTLLFADLLVANAQTGQLRGSVLVTGADGKPGPGAGALIDVYRTDISGEFHTKADKKGEWVFAGLPLVGTYVVSISAPGGQPQAIGGVRVVNETPVQVTLSAGDGRRLTADEAKKIAAGVRPSAGAGGGGGRESAEDKAKREEIERKNKEITEQNEKNKNINDIVSRTFKAGNAALMAKNFDEAIKQYQEGVAADPEQGALFTQLSTAYRNRGVSQYNAAIQAKDDAAKTAGFEAAKKDFKDAAEQATKAVDLAKKEPPATDPQGQTGQAQRKLAALSTRAESMRLFATKVDTTQADTALTAYEEYIAAETDATRKAQAQRDSAQMLLDAGQGDKAFAQFQKILANSPDDADANLGAGLALYSTGDKAKYQEAANYLQHFVDKAPENHKDKAAIKAVLEELKNTENVVPEKTAPSRRKRP